MTLQPGTVLHNRYRIAKLLGEGGFAAVYRAWDIHLNMACAVKENNDPSPEAARQFAREASILANLRHPNLPVVHDHFFVPAQGQYLVMDYIEGEDLQSMLDQRSAPLPLDDTLRWAKQICDALIYLHDQQPPLIHRDIKPANVKITPQGKAVLVDFGIAKMDDLNQKTTAGARAFTPGYSPPEQYGRGRTDTRSDIYSLGATMYACLTGQEPVESVERTLGIPLPGPRTLNGAIPLTVEQVVLKAMALMPGERFQSVKDFRDSLFQPVKPVQPVQRLVVPRQAAVSSPFIETPPPAQGMLAHRLWLPAVTVFILVAVVVAAIFTRLKQTVVGATASPVPTSAAPAVNTAPATSPTIQVILPTIEVTPSVVFTTTTEISPTSEMTPTTTPARSIIAEKDNMALLFIPAGEFLMGSADSDPLAQSNEWPQHKVYLKSFWIDSTEITNGMYAKCVRAGVCTRPVNTGSFSRASYYGYSKYDRFPVLFVTWQQSADYCKWAGRRLPTEAEWEKAARGTDGRLFPWGSLPPDKTRLNFNKNFGDTTPIGSFPEGGSPFGALDLAGNVWEWVADWYGEEYYANSPQQNPPGPAWGELKVMRGGSWMSDGQVVRSANRLGNPPTEGRSYLGFRCAR